jgi:hypothetical protein
MKKNIINEIEGHNIKVRLSFESGSNLYLIELIDPKTGKLLHNTCYSDKEKALQHMSAYSK